MAKQAIKYQSTTVAAEKSAGEIQSLVARYGGTRCEVRWDEKGNVSGVRFAVADPKMGEVPIRLMAKTDRIFEILQGTRRGYSAKSKHEETDRHQAYRIAWRQLKDITEQLLLAVQTGLFTLTEAFMSAIETEDPATGEAITMWQLAERYGAMERGGMRLLAPPTVVEADYEVIDYEGFQ